MKEYIDKAVLIAMCKGIAACDWNKKVAPVSWADAYERFADEVEDFDAADVVSKAAFDQVMWERDVAIQQLREDYGVGLGEKKAADVVEHKRGEWVEVSYWKYKNGHSIRYTAKRCSVCGADVGKKTQYNGCPYCFADMRSHQKFLCDQTEEVEHETD